MRRGILSAAGLIACLGPPRAAAHRRPGPVRYCLAYGSQPDAADTIRLAAALARGGGETAGPATALPFALDSMHTPRLQPRAGRWRDTGGGAIELTFGNDAWRYVYEIRRGASAGRVHVESDMHLDRVPAWRFTVHRCGAEPPGA